MESDGGLRLDRQLCFALYAGSKEIVRRYRPLLEPLGLTYTQYLTMMALWEEDGIPVKHLGDRLLLDSGTLTPLLKKLEAQGLVIRQRDGRDERAVRILLTEEGKALREKAEGIPLRIACITGLSTDDITVLHATLARLLGCLRFPGRDIPSEEK
jgi:DNA-binding MarR family transcriptional regulator